MEVNGDQPPSLEAGMEIFVRVRHDIEVVMVTHDRDGKPRASEHWYSIVSDPNPSIRWQTVVAGGPQVTVWLEDSESLG